MAIGMTEPPVQDQDTNYNHGIILERTADTRLKRIKIVHKPGMREHVQCGFAPISVCWIQASVLMYGETSGIAKKSRLGRSRLRVNKTVAP